VTQVVTSCTCDCPDTCSIIATVEDGAVVGIRGNRDFEVTRGFLCQKSRGFLKRVFSPDRVLHPLRKDRAGWRRIGWDQAADIIADKLDKALRTSGPLSVFYFRESGSIAALKLVNERFFNLLGGATFSTGSLCGGAGIAGQRLDFGLRTSHDPFDLLNSKLILIWGRNPAWTNVHLMPILRQARAAGAKVVLVDPVRTATAKVADWHLCPVPGSDAYLALGIAKVLIDEHLIANDYVAERTTGFERFAAMSNRHSLDVISKSTGVSAIDIRRLAHLFGSLKPAAVLGGWGLQRRRNGADTYRMLDALGALTGNIGVSGGGVSHGMDETRWFSRAVCLRERAAARREIPRPQTGRGLLEAAAPPVAVAVVSGGNPLNQCPNSDLVRQAFAEIDFVVVLDMFMTDTARAADIVLPATHFLQERDVVASYWHNYVMPVNVAQARLGEEKTDLEIFAGLGRRLGLDHELPDTPDYYLEQITSPLADEGIDLARIMLGPVRPESAVDVPFSENRFFTPSGRFEFASELGEPRISDTGRYPYHLLSPHPRQRTHSQLPGIFNHRIPSALISPAIASRHALNDGDKVVVTTPQGSLGCAVAVSGRVRDDTIVIYEGTWEQLGGSVNRLTSDELSDRGLSATYNDTMCNISKGASKLNAHSEPLAGDDMG
jgi:anaerobic selenocysteine-containing dehydrogenase